MPTHNEILHFYVTGSIARMAIRGNRTSDVVFNLFAHKDRAGAVGRLLGASKNRRALCRRLLSIPIRSRSRFLIGRGRALPLFVVVIIIVVGVVVASIWLAIVLLCRFRVFGRFFRGTPKCTKPGARQQVVDLSVGSCFVYVCAKCYTYHFRMDPRMPARFGFGFSTACSKHSRAM